MVIVIILLLAGSIAVQAQNAAINIVEGGRLLIELVKVFKKNPAGSSSVNAKADLCFLNSTTGSLAVELSRKINDSTYTTLPGSIQLLAKNNECLLELSIGIYRYKIFIKEYGTLQLSIEGELRLLANEKMVREIK